MVVFPQHHDWHPATQRYRVKESQPLSGSSPPLHCRESLLCFILHITGLSDFRVPDQVKMVQPRAHRFPYTWNSSSPLPQLLTQLNKYLYEFIFPEASACVEPSHKQSCEYKSQRAEHYGSWPAHKAQHSPTRGISDLDSHTTMVICLGCSSKLSADIASRIFIECTCENVQREQTAVDFSDFKLSHKLEPQLPLWIYQMKKKKSKCHFPRTHPP